MAIELRAGGTRAVILPEFGGRLHQLYVSIAGREEPLLLTPNDPGDYRDRPTRGGSFPMAPWPNRVDGGRFRWHDREYVLPLEGKPHAIHGRALYPQWDVLHVAETCCEMAVQFDDGWPWRGSAWQRFEVAPDSLRMTMEVRTETEPFPAGGGWHPWFRRDVGGATDMRLGVPAPAVYLSRDQLPTGEVTEPAGAADLRAAPFLGDRRIDVCYRDLSGPIHLDWGAFHLSMTVDCPRPHVMVYTPPEAVCVEPQSCAPDAFNLQGRGISGTGFDIAEPRRPVRVESTWTWELDPGYR
jgi:aldose 1-epimerase